MHFLHLTCCFLWHEIFKIWGTHSLFWGTVWCHVSFVFPMMFNDLTYYFSNVTLCDSLYILLCFLLNFIYLVCFFMCMSVLPLYMSVHQYLCLIPVEARRGYHIFWNRNYRWLWIARGVLGNELWSSTRVISAFNHWASSHPFKVLFLHSTLLYPYNPEKQNNWRTHY